MSCSPLALNYPSPSSRNSGEMPAPHSLQHPSLPRGFTDRRTPIGGATGQREPHQPIRTVSSVLPEHRDLSIWLHCSSSKIDGHHHLCHTTTALLLRQKTRSQQLAWTGCSWICSNEMSRLPWWLCAVSGLWRGADDERFPWQPHNRNLHTLISELKNGGGDVVAPRDFLPLNARNSCTQILSCCPGYPSVTEGKRAFPLLCDRC